MNYLVTGIGEGSLHVMAAPRPGQLHNHIRYLKMQGITNVLCLMEPIEMEHLGLDEEEAMALISQKRQLKIPETREQVEFFLAYTPHRAISSNPTTFPARI